MNLKLRQIAAAVLTVSLCLGSAAATGSVSELPAGDSSAAVWEAMAGDISLEEPAVGDGTNPVDENIPEGPVDDFVPEFDIDPDTLPDIYDPYAGRKLRIGLAYPGNSTGALISANLLNADMSAVSGYRFGYYDEQLDFVSLAATQETALTMLKTTNIYRVGESYYTTQPSGSYELLGCYHLQKPFVFATYEEAQAMAELTSDSFLAWTDGAYYVRKGSFATYDEAKAAADADPADNWSVSYTSVYGVNIVKTGTCQILFQFWYSSCKERNRYG